MPMAKGKIQFWFFTLLAVLVSAAVVKAFEEEDEAFNRDRKFYPRLGWPNVDRATVEFD